MTAGQSVISKLFRPAQSRVQRLQKISTSACCSLNSIVKICFLAIVIISLVGTSAAVGRRRIRHGKLVSPLAPLTSDITRIDDTGKKAVVTMVQNDAYVINALVLGYTLQKYNPSLVAQEGMDFVALLPTEHDLSSTSLDRLRQVGWQLRFEEEFLVNGTDNLPINYRRNFFKLNIWAWEEYVKMAYLDADCMVRGDITLLLSREYSFGAVQDTWPWAMPGENFNAGVLSLVPSVDTYEELLSRTLSNPIPSDAEQGVLNKFYSSVSATSDGAYGWPNVRAVLPMKYNLNVEAYETHRSQWDDIWPDVRVIHYTGGRKPRKPADGQMDFNNQPLRKWVEEFDEMMMKFEWTDL